MTCNFDLVLQKTRKEMESQIRKQKLRQISSAASLPNLSKVSVPCFFSPTLRFPSEVTSSSRQLSPVVIELSAKKEKIFH